MLADPAKLIQMRANARAYFEAHLTEEENFAQLTRIYSEVIAAAGRDARRQTG